MQIPTNQGIGSIEDEFDMVAIVDESFDRSWIWSTSIWVHSLLNPAVEGIINKVHLSGDDIGGIFNDDLGETIPVIPGVFAGFIAGDRSASSQIPFIVIEIVIGAVALETIIGSGLIPCDRAVSIQVIAIDFIGLKTLGDPCNLVSLVIAVGTASIDRTHLSDPTDRIIDPTIGIEIGRILGMNQLD
jgi:hypothetical protein